MQRDEAESIAIQALSFLAEDAERLGRFLALSGISPVEIRTQARDPAFLAGVLHHVTEFEPLLLAFADRIGCHPSQVAAAGTALGGAPWERDNP